MSELIERELAIFNAARRLAGGDRSAYLDRACAGDAALRQRLGELLSVEEAAGEFLEKAAQGDADAATMPAGTIRLSLPLSEKPGQWIGPYKLLQEIGEGGCGVVYMAEQEEPIRRRVALKVIKWGMDTKQVIARFEAERQALALMDHPNIAKVLDAGATETGRPYFVMELVRGVKVTEYCDQNNLSTEERLKLFVGICGAIQHAHQKGIIHRDIKPSNILVMLQDGKPVPKVIDFGIAKATGGQVLTNKTLFTAFEQFIGTPAYMSPEQAEMSALDIDTRSDIYSLGVLLYELLTGKTPFDARRLVEAGLDEIRRIIRNEEPPPPSTRLSALNAEEKTTTARRRDTDPPRLIHLVRGDLDWIAMKCLEKDRTRRYETANGLAGDVQRHLNNEPVVARPPSNLYRLQKMVRRNKLVFAAGGAVVLALVAGLALSTWSLLGERRANANAHRLLYVADMNLAGQAWDENNIGRVDQLLNETQAFPDRGFEWYYWQRQTHLCLKTFLKCGHGPVNIVAFSPDGQRIVAGSSVAGAKMWDAASGREPLVFPYVYAVAFSPDGQRIVTGTYGGTAKVWETASGKELLTLKFGNGSVQSVAFSPDGRRIVACSTGGARVWDTASGREPLTFPGVRAVAFSPDGQRIVTGSYGGKAKVWDAASGRELLTLNNGNYQISCVAFSPDNQRIVTVDSYETKLWDAASGRELVLRYPLTDRWRGGVSHVAFSPDGHRMVTVGGPVAKVWDAANGDELLILTNGNNYKISSGAFSPDGRRIVTGGADHTVKVWEAASGRLLFNIQGNAGGVESVAFSPDGRRIVAGTSDGPAKLWDAAKDEGPLTLKGKRNSGGVKSVAFSPDGQRIITCSELWAEEGARVWDAAGGQELLTLNHGNTYQITCAAFSPDGRRIVTGGSDKTAAVWDAANGRELLAFTGNKGSVKYVAFSPDSQRILTGGERGNAKVWDAVGGKEVLTLKGDSRGQWLSATFSPDGRRIVTGSDDQKAKLWDAASGEKLLTFNAGCFCAAFSPDGRRIVTDSSGGTAQVWDTASGKELLELKGHNDLVRAVAFSQDGRRIVTGSQDRTAKVWDAGSGRELLTLKGHGGMVLSVAFSPDGQRIVTGSDDGTAKVWEAARKEQVAQWQAEEAAALKH